MKKELEEYLLTSSLFAGLEEEDAKRLLKAAVPVHCSYEAGQTLREEQTVCNAFGIVYAGTLAAEREHSTGAPHIVEVYEQGDYFGLENAATKSRLSPVCIRALSNAEVVTFQLEHLLVGIADAQIKDNIIAILANESIRKLYKIDILSRAGLRERIMTYLRLRAAKTGSNTFRTGMTQETFAGYLSVNRSALSKELNDMRREGLINFRKDQFTILK